MNPQDPTDSSDSLESAARTSQRALLESLRNKIAAEVDSGVPPHALAPLSRQLRDIAKEIEAIDSRARDEEDDGELPSDAPWDPSML